MSLRKTAAFTLTEILIALVIIGVVAAITIPVIERHQYNTMVVEKLKKTYSTLTNAFNKAQIDYGAMNTWEYDDIGSSLNYVEKYLLPYVSYQEYGKKTNAEWGYKDGRHRADGTQKSAPTGNATALILADGTFLTFGTMKDSNGDVAYIQIFIDVNGPKPPNVHGKDIFVYTQWLEPGIPPTLGMFKMNNYVFERFYTRAENLETCRKGDGNADVACGGVIHGDGWRIADDYPWL